MSVRKPYLPRRQRIDRATMRLGIIVGALAITAIPARLLLSLALSATPF